MITDNAAAVRANGATVAHGTASKELVTSPDCPGPVVEAFHTLFTNVDLALGQDRGGVVAVAALDDTADASLVAANLALIAGQGGDRTLLIDGNAQTPRLDALFGLQRTPGLAQLLAEGHDNLRALAQPTMLPTLGVVVSGVEGARHNRLDRLGDVPAALLRCKNAADRVILHLAPVLTSTDVLRLGSYVDGVVLVLTPGRTRREEASRAQGLLEKSQARVLGVALTPR